MKIDTHYDTLKVTQDAPKEVISAAYKALAHLYHPDKAGNDPQAVVMMQKINISYKILSDPAKRAEHDRWISQHERRAEPVAGQQRQRVSEGEKGKTEKAAAEAAKWKLWVDKVELEAKEAQGRLDKALADFAKAKPEDRPKWDAWVKKTTQEAREAKDRADKAAQQYEKLLADAVEKSK